MVGTLERRVPPSATHTLEREPPHRPETLRARHFSQRHARLLNTGAPVIAFALLLIIWKLVAIVGDYKPFLLPSPEAVAGSFRDALEAGIRWPHLRTTLMEAGYGAFAGIFVAFTLDYVLVHIPLLDRALSPRSRARRVVSIASRAARATTCSSCSRRQV